MKKPFLAILIFILILTVFFVFSDVGAAYIWKNFKNEQIALRLIRNDAQLAYKIGEYYFGQGAYDLDIAEIAFKKTLLIDQRYFLANYQLARIYFVKGQKELALEAINKELKYYPENRRSYYVRGLIYGFSDKLPEAESDFKIFTAWAPSEWAGWNDLAWILEKEEKYAEAKSSLVFAMGTVPEGGENSWLQNSLGVACLNLKEYKCAVTAFKKATELVNIMSPAEWKKAYPGNSEEDAKKGFAKFKAAIDANLFKARYVNSGL